MWNPYRRSRSGVCLLCQFECLLGMSNHALVPARLVKVGKSLCYVSSLNEANVHSCANSSVITWGW